MFTVLPHVLQSANRSLTESALPGAAVVQDDHFDLAALVSRLHQHR